jgi:DNA-binding MarR family transcriptional regulator
MIKDVHRVEGRDESLRLDRQVCFPLYAATNLLQRLYRPLLAPLGLTFSQYLVMLVLWEEQPVPIGELCGCLHLDMGTLSPLLKRMEQAGFITRRRDATDERRVLIGLTPQGRSLHDSARDIPSTLARQTGLEPKEYEQLRDQAMTLVAKLAAAVG